MRTTFVVVNYNGEKYIEKCIESILSQTCKKFRILVVDNASTDGSIQIIRNIADRSSKVEVIRNDENVGFAKAVNQALELIESGLIALVNNDVFLDSRWLEEMVKSARSDLRAGIFASRIYFLNGLINSTGHAIYRGLAVMERGFFERDLGQYDESCYVAGACAAAALYRRKLFEDIGFFDEDYFMYNEDVDLSLRAILRGWKIRYVPTAIAYHVHSASTGFLSDFSVYYNSRNWVWSVLKNAPRRILIKELPFFLLRNLTSVIYFCLNGKFTVIKSKIDAIKELGEVFKKREIVRRGKRFERFEEYIDGFGWKVLKNVWLSKAERCDNNIDKVRV
ncbi:glycosyltransferase family 2 protein [Archaeoglobus profundus]|uniref:Glycosyl transferase family 2 n=1 Tax=Archaeoglobus profundus (strain DSM 5631 / JCM 9629 / NBRC 100127 / Av18) TaxID=572546 RepID=D2RDR2_ARCPA|nr:glycosyltransferase family 2 protein [Archaeoglobus profundus]ADB58256.1 glycosyl transferase family 2 [Archaeoglobus profundus DSM 5631]